MSFIYTRSDLKTRMNAGIQGKIGMLIDADDTVNEAVRNVFSKVDLRSARRRATLTPSLFNGIFDYTCATDLKAYGIIDVPAQAKRDDGAFFLIPPTEFDIKKPAGAVAIDDFNGVRSLKIASQVEDFSIVLSELDSITSGGGTWALFGDATGVAADIDDYVKGNGALKFNISAVGGTTAGIQNSTLNSVDITDYLGGNGAVFVWAKINSTTGLTNYILRLGNDASNYYSKTVTTQADGTAFVAGWNLLKFDLTSLVETGSVDDTVIDYAVIYMTKLGSKISESDYKFDWLVLKRGVTANVKYYSKYGWQSSAGAYKENSTDDSDLLVADTDEFNLLINEARALASLEVLTETEQVSLQKRSDDAIASYRLNNPSEAQIMTNEYYVY